MIRSAQAQQTEGAAEPATPPPNLVDLIDGLVEPTAPMPIALTPQTGGWLVLAVLGVALLVWVFWRWRRHRRANAYRRAALMQVQGAQVDAALVARTLRQAALAAFPRQQVAGLSGQAWLDFLSRTGAGDFSGATGADLLAAPYKGDPQTASDALLTAARAWLEAHKGELAVPSDGARAQEAGA